MDRLFKNISQKILIYYSKETVDDPYEQNVSRTTYNPVPINAIVTDLTNTKARYAMPGIVTEKAKEIVIKKGHEALLQMSYKIKIDSETGDYVGWTESGRLQYRKEGDYIRAYIYSKHDE